MNNPTWISLTSEDVPILIKCCLYNEMEKRTALPNVMCWSIFIKHDIERHAGILRDWTTANKTNQSVERPTSGEWERDRIEGRRRGEIREQRRNKKSLSHSLWCLSRTQGEFLRGTALVWREFLLWHFSLYYPPHINAAQQITLNHDRERGGRKCCCTFWKKPSLWYIVFLLGVFFNCKEVKGCTWESL